MRTRGLSRFRASPAGGMKGAIESRIYRLGTELTTNLTDLDGQPTDLRTELVLGGQYLNASRLSPVGSLAIGATGPPSPPSVASRALGPPVPARKAPQGEFVETLYG